MYKLKLFFILLISLVMAQVGNAHVVEHLNESPFDKKRIHHLFEDIQKEHLLVARFYHIRESDGSLTQRERSAVVSFLMKSLMAVQSELLASLTCDHCAGTLERESRELLQLTLAKTGSRLMKLAREKAHEFTEIYEHRRKIGRKLLGEIANKSGELGVSTAATYVLFVGMTWPLWTTTTEFIESVFVGPLYVACHFFQFAYFGALNKTVHFLQEDLFLMRATPGLSLFTRNRIMRNSKRIHAELNRLKVLSIFL